MTNVYSYDKALWHTKHLDMLREGDQPAPLHVQLIITNRCQQNCPWCAYRLRGYTSNEQFHARDEIATANVLEILDACRRLGVKAIQFTGGGEPLLHPDCDPLFRAALDRGLQIALVTNGTLLQDDTARLLGERATWIRVSLDAGRAETYAAIRRVQPREFVKAQKAIAALVAHSRGGGAYLGVGFVVNKDNWREVPDAAMLCRNLGVDNFRISGVFQSDGEKYFASFYDEAYALCKQTEALSSATFTVSNMFGDRIEDLRQQHPDYRFCMYQNFCTYIGADKWVYRCCNTAYSARGRLGLITADRPFDAIWREANLKDFDARGCPRCQFNAKNRAIQAAIVDPPLSVPKPMHENFV